jgi:hypothetical protein
VICIVHQFCFRSSILFSIHRRFCFPFVVESVFVDSVFVHRFCFPFIVDSVFCRFGFHSSILFSICRFYFSFANSDKERAKSFGATMEIDDGLH